MPQKLLAAANPKLYFGMVKEYPAGIKQFLWLCLGILYPFWLIGVIIAWPVIMILKGVGWVLFQIWWFCTGWFWKRLGGEKPNAEKRKQIDEERRPRWKRSATSSYSEAPAEAAFRRDDGGRPGSSTAADRVGHGDRHARRAARRRHGRPDRDRLHQHVQVRMGPGHRRQHRDGNVRRPGWLQGRHRLGARDRRADRLRRRHVDGRHALRDAATAVVVARPHRSPPSGSPG